MTDESCQFASLINSVLRETRFVKEGDIKLCIIVFVCISVTRFILAQSNIIFYNQINIIFSWETREILHWWSDINISPFKCWMLMWTFLCSVQVKFEFQEVPMKNTKFDMTIIMHQKIFWVNSKVKKKRLQSMKCALRLISSELLLNYFRNIFIFRSVSDIFY